MAAGGIGSAAGILKGLFGGGGGDARKQKREERKKRTAQEGREQATRALQMKPFRVQESSFDSPFTLGQNDNRILGKNKF